MKGLALSSCVGVLVLLPAAVVAQPVLPEGASPPSGLVEPRPLVPVPGTRVSIAPPPGFAPSDSFAGFHRPDAGASIVVNELAAPVAAVQANMTEGALAEQGMELLSSSQAVAGGIVGRLYSVREQVRGIDYRKWLAVFGNENETVILSASFPERLAERLALPLKDSLLTSGWNPRARVQLQAGLPFAVPETEGLRVLRRVGGMLMMADPARADSPSPTDPMLVVGEAVAGRSIDDPAAFSRERLRQFDRVRDLRDLSGTALEVDERGAYELTATGDDVYGGGPLRVYQLVVPAGRSYTLVQGLVGADEAAVYLPRFRQVAHGLSFAP